MSSKVTGREGYSTTLNNYIPGALVRGDQDAAIIISLLCKTCGDEVEAFRSNVFMPPDQVLKMISQRGWHVGNGPRKHVCPSHKKEKKMAANDVAAPLRAVPAAVPLVPSPDAKAARREALQWIAEAYDVATGRYADGTTDASIAKETKLSENAVAELREEFYGPLKMPSDIETAMRELRDIESKRTAMVADFASLATALRERTDAVSARIDALKRANGWR